MNDVLTMSIPIKEICFDGNLIDEVIVFLREVGIIAEFCGRKLEMYIKKDELQYHNHLEVILNRVFSMIREAEREVLGLC